MRRLDPSRAPATALLALVCAVACAAPGASTPPPKPPQYANALAEALDLPKQMEAQADWALAPIGEAEALARDIEATRGRVDLEPDTFNAVCRAAFEGKPAPAGALDGLPPEQRAELEALTARLSTIAADLESVPKRTSVAGLAMFKIGIKAIGVVKKAADEVKANPAAVAGGVKAITQLPGDLKRLGPKLKTGMKAAPADAAKATKNLLAALGKRGGGDEDAAPAVSAEDEGSPPDEDPLTGPGPVPEPEPEPEPAHDPAPTAEPEASPEPAPTDGPAPRPAPPPVVKEDATPPSTPAVDRPRPRGLQIAGYTAIGVGVALGVGLVSGGWVRGMKGYDGYTAATTAQGEADNARTYESGRAMIIAGAVTGSLLAVTGVTLVVLDAVRIKQRRVAVLPVPTLTGGALVLTRSF